jgi:hypothetical protein
MFWLSGWTRTSNPPVNSCGSPDLSRSMSTMMIRPLSDLRRASAHISTAVTLDVTAYSDPVTSQTASQLGDISAEVVGHFYEAALSSYRLVEAALVFIDKPPVSAHSPLTSEEGWARERVTRRQPRRQASFLTPPWRGGSPFYARSGRHSTGRAHEKNPTEESRSLRDGSQERPPVPTR